MDELKQKLLSKTIKKAGPLDTPCWIWFGGTNGKGYGTIKWNSKDYVVHRAAWMVYNGPIPDGLLVLHKCDVRDCLNPGHLFLGTNQDNTDDMMTKGRHVGMLGYRLVAPEQAAQMAVLRQQGLSYARIATRFMVCKNTVRNYLNRGQTG